MYLCQFPFELDRPVPLVSWEKLQSFDTVAVNSAYTYSWYLKYTLPQVIGLEDVDYQMPSLLIISSPIGGSNFLATVSKSLDLLKTQSSPLEQINIVMLGRIFHSRQNKGYHVAIPTFKRLLDADGGQHKLQLHIIGNLQRSTDSDSYKYLADLKAMAKGLPVSFHVGTSTNELDSLMRNGTIFWHMTGIDQPRVGEDPASLEHFGIANLEGMAYGMIPIVLDRGGPSEATLHGWNGFVARSAQEFVTYSLRIIRMDAERRKSICRRAVLSSRYYDVSNFKLKMESALRRGVAQALFRDFRDELKEQVSLFHIPDIPLSSSKTAVIVEAGIERAFAFCVMNVMHFLGDGWALQVHHTAENEAFVKYSLRNLNGVQFVLRDEKLHQIEEYNRLFKSPKFWRSLKTERVLFFQSDSIILSFKIHEYLGYDYIGAPLEFGINRSRKNLVAIGTSQSGSGGFSYRNATIMEQIAERYGAISPKEENEGEFFLQILRKSTAAQLPTLEQSYEFCKAVEIRNLSSVTHHAALHGAWYYCDDRCILFDDLRRSIQKSAFRMLPLISGLWS